MAAREIRKIWNGIERKGRLRELKKYFFEFSFLIYEPLDEKCEEWKGNNRF